MAPIGVLFLLAASGLIVSAQQTEPEHLIERGHWKSARTLVEARLRQAPNDPLAHFLLSQIRYAFGDRISPLALAEQSVSLAGCGKSRRRRESASSQQPLHAI